MRRLFAFLGWLILDIGVPVVIGSVFYISCLIVRDVIIYRVLGHRDAVQQELKE